MMDKIEAIKDECAVQSFGQMCDLCRSCGLPTSDGFGLEGEVVLALTYLNELGVVMWYDEPALRDLVILVRPCCALHFVVSCFVVVFTLTWWWLVLMTFWCRTRTG